MYVSNLKIFLTIILSLIISFGGNYLYNNPQILQPDNIYVFIFKKPSAKIKKIISSSKLFNFYDLFTIKPLSKSQNLSNNFINQSSSFNLIVKPTTPPIVLPTKEINPNIIPTITILKNPTKKLTIKPKPTTKPKPTSTPTPLPTPTIGLQRPGNSVDEVIEYISKTLCIPAPMLHAILENESGERYNKMSPETFRLYNSYGWWQSDKITSKDQICHYTAFNNKTGYIPEDSKFAGEFCLIGDIADSMGPMSITSFVWDALKTRIENFLNQKTIDRRVFFDSLVCATYYLKNVSQYKGESCDHWDLKYVAKAACKYLSMCIYTGFGSNRNYCIDACNNYNKYSNIKLDCDKTMSVITNDCQFK